MQGCRSGVKTGRNRNNWRLVIGMPTGSYSEAIHNCFFAFRKPLYLFLLSFDRVLFSFGAETARWYAAERCNLICIKFYDCPESVAQRRDAFRHEMVGSRQAGQAESCHAIVPAKSTDFNLKVCHVRSSFNRPL